METQSQPLFQTLSGISSLTDEEAIEVYGFIRTSGRSTQLLVVVQPDLQRVSEQQFL